MIKALFLRQIGNQYSNRSLYKLSNLDDHSAEVIEILRSGTVSYDLLKYYLETILNNVNSVVLYDIKIFFDLIKKHQDYKEIVAYVCQIIIKVVEKVSEEIDLDNNHDHSEIFTVIEPNFEHILELYCLNYESNHYIDCINSIVNLLLRLDVDIHLHVYFNIDLVCKVIHNSIITKYMNFELIKNIIYYSPIIYYNNDVLYIIENTELVQYLLYSLSILKDITSIQHIFLLLKTLISSFRENNDINSLKKLQNLLDNHNGIELIFNTKTYIDLQPVNNDIIDKTFAFIMGTYILILKDVQTIQKFNSFFDNLLNQVNYHDISVNMNIALYTTSIEELSQYIDIDIQKLVKYIDRMTPNLLRDFCCYLHNKMLENNQNHQHIMMTMNKPINAHTLLNSINIRLKCIFIDQHELLDLTESIYELSFTTSTIIEIISIETLVNALSFKYRIETGECPFVYIVKILWNISDNSEMRNKMVSNNVITLLNKKIETYSYNEEFIEWAKNLVARLKHQM